VDGLTDIISAVEKDFLIGQIEFVACTVQRLARECGRKYKNDEVSLTLCAPVVIYI
jgi:hypothetical protein